MRQFKSHVRFQKFPAVTPPNPFWCFNPESGPLPSKIMAVRPTITVD